jgi:NAD(P)-dependent dehydrogenase (short-subunit alcohol dehydrogenase family)
MALALEGKIALVTGGSRGIGRAIAERLAANGASVVINYARSPQAAQEVMKNILATGGRAITVQADISKPAEVRRLFNEAEKAMGHLDIVIANAGVVLEKPLIESTEEDYDSVFNINTKGVFFTLQEASRRVRDGGRIVAVSTGGHENAFRQLVALSWQQRGHRAVRSLALARIGVAQRHGQHSFSRVHGYGYATRAVSRLRREPVALQSCGHGEGSSRRGCLSCERCCRLGNRRESASGRRGGLRSLHDGQKDLGKERKNRYEILDCSIAHWRRKHLSRNKTGAARKPAAGRGAAYHATIRVELR